MRRLPLDQIEELYDGNYYATDCDGYEEFARSRGTRLPRRLAKCAKLAGISGADRVVDVGCGRGELALASARLGAEVIALDPSSSAVDHLREHNSDTSLLPARARGGALPIADNWATVIFLTDVVEHLPQPELEETLRECRRVLAPGGRLIVHTQPNRLLLDCTVPLLSRVSRSWGVSLPRDLREEMTPGSRQPYHINEQSMGQLRRTLTKCGFEIGEAWLEGSYPLHRIFGETRFKQWILTRFRRSAVLKNFFASQLFAIANPTTGRLNA